MRSCPYLPFCATLSDRKDVVFLDTAQLTLILSALTTIIALVSPSVTAFINNRAEYKRLSAKLFFASKMEAYKDFLSAAASASYPLTPEDFCKLTDASSRVLIFSNETVQNAVSKYFSALLSCPGNPSEKDVQKLIDSKADCLLAMQTDMRTFK